VTKTNASAHLTWSKSKIREGTPKGARRTMEKRFCETDEASLPRCASTQSQFVRASGICCCWPNCLDVNSHSDDMRDPTLSADSFRHLLKTRLFSEY